LAKVAYLNLPPAFGSLMGVTSVEFRPDLWHQKTSLWDIVYRVSHFDAILACDRQTHRHKTIAYQCIASHKNKMTSNKIMPS